MFFARSLNSVVWGGSLVRFRCMVPGRFIRLDCLHNFVIRLFRRLDVFGLVAVVLCLAHFAYCVVRVGYCGLQILLDSFRMWLIKE